MIERDITHDQSEPATDRNVLTSRAYAAAGPLAARQAIYRYLQPPGGFIDWALGRYVWHGAERVLDAGCGNGLYLGRLATRHPEPLTGLDLSSGMLRGVASSWPDELPRPHLVVGDVQDLPFPDGSFDIVLAMHMLYHVPDIGQAVAELGRVLRPGGTLLASTNAERDKHEIDDLLDAAARLGGRPVPLSANPALRFSLENGEGLLSVAFAQVDVAISERQLVIPEPEPLLAYIASMESLLAPLDTALPSGTTWSMLLDEVRRLVEEEIARSGAFRIGAQAGVFACR